MTDTPGAILEELMKQAGEPPAEQRATFSGADPVLPTPFRIGDLGAAVIAAGAVQAARLLEQRAGLARRRCTSTWTRRRRGCAPPGT